MRAYRAFGLVALCVFAVSTLYAAPQQEVVTNAPPALSAAMSLVSSDGITFSWLITGKVGPQFRGHGASVHLVCTPYRSIVNGSSAGQMVFPVGDCDGDFCPGASNVDACGNFAITASVPGAAQLDPSYVCNFVVHVDDGQLPQSCSDPHGTGAPEAVTDPNGSSPCSGGLCPSAK